MVEIVRKERPDGRPEPEQRGQPESVNPSTLQPEYQPQPQPREWDDGIRAVDPNTGQPMKTELDEIPLPPGNDWLRAIYEVLLWATNSFVGFAKTTPHLAALNPELEQTIDQVCTIGYQVTNAGAELSRGLWNWPTSRVGINKQIESLLFPEESRMFETLFIEWYRDIVEPIEAGTEQANPKKEVEWVKAHPEIADPRGFLVLARSKYRMEKVAAASMWTPTDMFKLTQPGGTRQTSTTNIHTVFRKRLG